MPALDGRRRARQDAWASADAASSSPVAFCAPPLSTSSSGGGVLPSPPGVRLFSRPVPSLFPRAAFPQEDEGVTRTQSSTAAVAADDLLSLILSAAPSRTGERVESCQDERTVRESANVGSEVARLCQDHEEDGRNVDEEDDDAEGNTSEEQPVRTETRGASKKRQATAIAGQRTREKEKEKDVPAPTPKRRYKKPTYIVRREKKEVLEAELRELSETLVRLRKESGIPAWFFQQKEALAEKSLENVRLRDAMSQHDMYLANASRLMLAEYMSIHRESPIETFIHLTSDLKMRRRTLMGLKDFKLDQADKFITESTQCMHRIKHWCQESKYEADNGDFCAIKMDNTPFRGVKSVRQVFDALQFFFRNMEISISEMLGDITVREDDDSPDNSLSNHRLVSVMSHGMKVEKNIVKFFKYVEPEDGSAPYALVATDAVNVDELYPYIPEERIRMDINAAMKFTEHFVKKPKHAQASRARGVDTIATGRRAGSGGRHRGVNYVDDVDGGDDGDDGSDDGDDGDEFERVVVLTRFFRAKLHHTEIEMPAHVLQEIRQGLACFTDTMVKTMHRIIFETKRGQV